MHGGDVCLHANQDDLEHPPKELRVGDCEPFPGAGPRVDGRGAKGGMPRALQATKAVACLILEFV